MEEHPIGKKVTWLIVGILFFIILLGILIKIDSLMEPNKNSKVFINYVNESKDYRLFLINN